ncbi:putative DD41D transposase [Trichonephila clavipes]|nr:putative DD41D transposase [Trichonephila clavipes]
MLENFVAPQMLQHLSLDSITFMQDGAPPHIGLCVQQFLRQHFTNDRVISRAFPTAWPLRSPDLNPYGDRFKSCQVIYSQFGLAIHQNDHQERRRFVEWAQNKIAVVPDFHKRILFGDETQFWLNGYVNKQNFRIWSEATLQVYVKTPLHPEKLTVWCALWACGIIGPYFFKNDEGYNVTVNGNRYRAMITNFFIPELNDHDVQELWFQQDGATCHTARATIDLLKDTFGDSLISRFGPVNWPPRSCNLTPLDYFLSGYVKSLVYADRPQTLDHLEDNICRVIADIRPQMLENSSKIGRPDWTTSEPAVAVIYQKSYLKCNAKRLSFE